MNKVLIIAPHVDDEMIGCWSVLNRKDIDLTVLYLYELTDDRKKEALYAAHVFNFTACFGDVPGSTFAASFDEVYVPSRRDWHADHKLANRTYRKFATSFYSVNMAHGVLLSSAYQKRGYLNDCYPSQANLWATNDKYWLFEDIQKLDYDVYSNLGWTLTSGIMVGHLVQVTVLQQYSQWVNDAWWLKHRSTFKGGKFPDDAVNSLLEHCSGRVILKDAYGTIIEA